jgi:predicted enzyme related to lactoylglutathione lyase
MPEMADYPPGTFSWVELATTDSAAAKRFYSALFGWEGTDNPVGAHMLYTMLRLDGENVAALYGLDDGAPERIPVARWLSYVAVESADASAARAAELGGKVLTAAFDVGEVGRMARIEDPTGVVVALWQAGTHSGARRVNEPGALTWNELATHDVPKAREFYTRLFGWTAREQETPMPYVTFYNGERPAGGLFTPPAGWGRPPDWIVYFGVADCDASAARTAELGGRVLSQPRDIPGIGRFATLEDPQGAVFAIIRLA